MVKLQEDVYTVQLIRISCWSCGVTYGIPESLYTTRKRDRGAFYCPNGHGAAFTETEADELRSQLAKEARRRESLESDVKWGQERIKALNNDIRHVHSRLSATRGVVTRIKNRVAKGVCPCCNRTFTDLWSHMQTQHPDFEKEQLP